MTCGTLVYFPQSFIGIVCHQQLAVLEAAVGVVGVPGVPDWQTAAGGKMAFAVASVKPAKGPTA
jgi:hypothetical protein